MAITHIAAFPQAPKIDTAIVTLADDLTVAATNALPVIVAGANGAEVSSFTAIPLATVTAASLHLFLQKGGAGDKVLFNSVLMPAHTVTAATAVPVSDFGYALDNTLLLDAGDIVYFGSAVALVGGIAGTGQWVDL